MVNLSRHSQRQACVCATARDVANHSIKLLPAGEPGSLEYRMYFANSESRAISPWHSVPLYASQGLLNFVCEIPQNTRAKFEVATNEPGNPIKQDSKNGKPRSYAIDILWNYGMLPQTWEDPTHASEDCDGHLGDNDPVDVVEISGIKATSGGIYAVKPIGAFAMIDEGELDWKVVAISAKDPRCDLVNDVSDMEEHFPGTLSAIREWFRTYKTFDGKPLNKFALDERCMSRDYTLATISQTHAFWKSMVSRSRSGAEGVKLAVGDVPVPARCFDATALHAKATEAKEAELTQVKVQEGVEKLKEVIDAVRPMAGISLNIPRTFSLKRPSVDGDADGSIHHDSKRVELVAA